MSTRTHYIAVTELLDADPFSAKAAALRIEIDGMERKDPTLLKEKIAIFAAHTTPIGAMPPAQREPEGMMLT